jgi:hypothetical protein
MCGAAKIASRQYNSTMLTQYLLLLRGPASVNIFDSLVTNILLLLPETMPKRLLCSYRD